MLLYEGSSLYRLNSLTKTQPRVSSQFTKTDQNRWDRSETDQNQLKMTQENTETDIIVSERGLNTYLVG